MKLAELEARFHALVTAPESVAATLAARGEVGRAERAALETAIVGDARLGAVERLDIYAGMYFFRIRDVLAAEYPCMAARLGADAFHDLVTDYLVACPPGHPSLREVGARLPDFLSTHRRGVERPWLAELARLERTRLELVDAADAVPLALAGIQAIRPDQLGALELRLIPASALLTNRFSVAALWREGTVDETAPPSLAPETLLVWRADDLEIRHRPVDATEAPWLARARDGIAFAALAEGLHASLGPAASDEVAAARTFELCARWLADGVLATS